MGKFIDFAVAYNPEVDKESDIAERILISLFLKRLKDKKPCVIFVGGDSGEGKSFSALTIQQVLTKAQGIDLRAIFNDINVYKPQEYPVKLDNILFDTEKTGRLKKANIICVHEAREVVKAKLWRTFINQAISDVNAMSRTVKRLCFITISQFIRDISTDVRYTLNFYITCFRPHGHGTQIKIHVVWKDDSDLEAPKLRKRGIRGYLVYPDGKRRLIVPKHIELRKPDKDLAELFDKNEFAAKSDIIKRKMEKLMAQMNAEDKNESAKVDGMVKFYSDNPEHFKQIVKRWSKNVPIIKPEVKLMHELTDVEYKDFQKKIAQAITEKPKEEIKEAVKEDIDYFAEGGDENG